MKEIKSTDKNVNKQDKNYLHKSIHRIQEVILGLRQAKPLNADCLVVFYCTVIEWL